MSSKYDFQNVCRTCLSTVNLKFMYDKCSLKDSLDTMLFVCTSLEYYENDGLPVKICADCINEVNRCYKFAQKCRKADTKLRRYMQNLVPQEYALPHCSNINNYGQSSKTKTPPLNDPLKLPELQNLELVTIKNELHDENNLAIKIEPNHAEYPVEIDKQVDDGSPTEFCNKIEQFSDDQPDLSGEILDSNSDEHDPVLAEVTIVIDEDEPKSKQRRMWVQPRLLNRKIEGDFFTLYKVLQDDETEFYLHFKMSKTKFNVLLSKIGTVLQKKNTQFREAVPPIQKLAVCLRFLTTADSFRTIAFSYRLGKSTVHNIVKEVCKAIIDMMMSEAMPTPSKADWLRIAEDFWVRRHFPNCIGALGGKQTKILAPANKKLQPNYEKTFSVVLLGLFDVNYKFIAVDIGSYENSTEGGIYTKSKLPRIFESTAFGIPENKNLPSTDQLAPHVMVADESFPLKPYMMRPYPALQLENDAEKKIFNYRVSRAQRVAEHAFEILGQTFQIYNRKLTSKPDNVDNCILASCILHNFIRDDQVCSSQERFDHIPINLLSIPKQGGNSTRAAINVREIYKTYFNSQAGSVPWQAEKI